MFYSIRRVAVDSLAYHHIRLGKGDLQMKRWCKRIGLWFGVPLLLVVSITSINFYRWRADIVERIENDPDRKIVCTPRGEVEYAVVGSGLPLLVLHGAPAGYDQSLARLRAMPAATLTTMTIAVSRPGFLGTPLSSGSTHAEQADLFAALLDELEIDRVVVIASSSGGRAGLQFAMRHPDRTIGLILNSAGTKTDLVERPDLGDLALLAGDFYLWLVAKVSPSLMFGDEYVRAIHSKSHMWLNSSNQSSH